MDIDSIFSYLRKRGKIKHNFIENRQRERERERRT